MKEITHKGLARLVGLYGSHVISSDNLQILESSSVEPDEIKREGIGKGMSEKVMSVIGWFAEHTYRAKELAIDNINKAFKSYNSSDPSWSRWLGWCFHFITDWLTPYHSLKSMKKYISDSKSDKFNEEPKNGWERFFIILDGISNLFKFKAEHDKFEDICEKRWQQNESIITESFIRFKKKSISSVDLELFSKLMDKLQVKCENKLLDWITDCSNQEFAWYMTDIAKAMDIACRIVLG